MFLWMYRQRHCIWSQIQNRLEWLTMDLEWTRNGLGLDLVLDWSLTISRFTDRYIFRDPCKTHERPIRHSWEIYKTLKKHMRDQFKTDGWHLRVLLVLGKFTFWQSQTFTTESCFKILVWKFSWELAGTIYVLMCSCITFFDKFPWEHKKFLWVLART